MDTALSKRKRGGGGGVQWEGLKTYLVGTGVYSYCLSL
jgi:hypothetical protein